MSPVAQSWWSRALCREVGGDFWYPEFGDTGINAKRICRRCEVRSECLEYALANDEPEGIWGGKTARERVALKKGRA